MIRLMLVMAAFLAASAAFADDDEPSLTPQQILEGADDALWRTVDQDDLLYMDLPAGLVIIEMRADFAPAHVEQIKTLVRDGFYNGLTFHRVVEGFVAQGGDPKADGTGHSHLPNIAGEFTRETSNVEYATAIGRDRIAARVGYIDGMPFGAEPEGLRDFRSDRRVELWGLHCPGVMSMARAADPNTANSQFFIVIGDSRLSLDRRYTAWGIILDGYEATRRIVRGEPPNRPTPIIRARLGSDTPANEQRKIEVFRTDSETFVRYLKARSELDDSGYMKDICSVKVPVRINGKIER